ncbi:MAG: hypothetical protein GOVbin4206_86 [Prokaryotic dsDNA virus sp.]|nr:MAG: hypothetical protein GOVbin4206_86 [Prokaryotic dsDNA virus sp.]
MILKVNPYDSIKETAEQYFLKLNNGEKVKIFLTKHFSDNLQLRFPDIKMKRIKNAIERKLNRGQLPKKTTIIVKLVRQKKKNAYLVIKRYSRNIHVKTITYMRKEQEDRYSIIEEN